MIDVINNSMSYLSDSDIEAIATYLKSLPATSPEQAVAYNDSTLGALLSKPSSFSRSTPLGCASGPFWVRCWCCAATSRTTSRPAEW